MRGLVRSQCSEEAGQGFTEGPAPRAALSSQSRLVVMEAKVSSRRRPRCRPKQQAGQKPRQGTTAPAPGSQDPNSHQQEPGRGSWTTGAGADGPTVEGEAGRKPWASAASSAPTWGPLPAHSSGRRRRPSTSTTSLQPLGLRPPGTPVRTVPATFSAFAPLGLPLLRPADLPSQPGAGPPSAALPEWV